MWLCLLYNASPLKEGNLQRILVSSFFWGNSSRSLVSNDIHHRQRQQQQALADLLFLLAL